MKKICLILMAVSLLLLAACGEPQIDESAGSVTASGPDLDSITADLSELATSVLGEDVKEAWLDAIGSDGLAPDMAAILRAVVESGKKISLDDLKAGVLEILESGDYDTVDISSALSDSDKTDILGTMITEAWEELKDSIKFSDLTKLLKLLK